MRAVVLRVRQEGQDAETAVHAAACFSSVLPSTNRSGLALGRSTPRLSALLPLPVSRRHWPRPPAPAEGDSTKRPIAISFSHALRVEARPSGLELPFRALGFQFGLCGWIRDLLRAGGVCEEIPTSKLQSGGSRPK